MHIILNTREDPLAEPSLEVSLTPSALAVRYDLACGTDTCIHTNTRMGLEAKWSPVYRRIRHVQAKLMRSPK